MGTESAIQWTDATWNVARGCRKVDADCKYCYMYRDSFNGTRYEPKEVKRTKTVFNLPLKIKTPSRIFTSSLTDVFIEEIDSYRNEIWDIIRKCPQHTFQILTKRPHRITANLPPDWGEGWDNVWLGTSCGSDASKQRMMDLMQVKCKTRFLSLEPLHGEFFLESETFHWHELIHWVIVGGESGHDTGLYRYRPCEIEWIERIVRDCNSVNVPCFVKQMGTHLAKKFGMSDRHGGNIDEFPEHLQVREFPL